jgi:hypothetical protein
VIAALRASFEHFEQGSRLGVRNPEHFLEEEIIGNPSRSTVNIKLRSITLPFIFSGNTSTVCPSLNGRQTERNRLAVMLLTIVQTARKPTPITAAALISKAQMPLTSETKHMSSQFFSDWVMVLGYVVAPLGFGAFLSYGVLRTRRTKPSEVTDRATKAVYDADERERRQKAQAAEKSSRSIDVIKRKTDTTG